jgi:hypothetical protein
MKEDQVFPGGTLLFAEGAYPIIGRLGEKRTQIMGKEPLSP